MRYRWLIIDGNNLIHRDPALFRVGRGNFDAARDELVRQLDHLVGDLADRITIVFDGKSGSPGMARPSAAVEVVFSPAHLTADSVIERMVGDLPDREGIAVVSSDRLERNTVEATGVNTLSCASFLEVLAARQTSLQKQIRATGKTSPPGTLGDFF